MEPSPPSPTLPCSRFLTALLSISVFLAGWAGLAALEEAEGAAHPAPMAASGSLGKPGPHQEPIILDTRRLKPQDAAATSAPPPQTTGKPPLRTPGVLQEAAPASWPKGFQGDLTMIDRLRGLDITRRPPPRPVQPEFTPQPLEPPRVEIFDHYPHVPYYYGRGYHLYNYPPLYGYPPSMGGFVPQPGFGPRVYPGRGHFAFGRGFHGQAGGFQGGRGFRGR